MNDYMDDWTNNEGILLSHVSKTKSCEIVVRFGVSGEIRRTYQFCCYW